MSGESGTAAERTIGEAKLQYQAIIKWNKHVPLDVDEFRNLSSLVEMTQILELTYVWHESHYIVSGLNEVLKILKLSTLKDEFLHHLREFLNQSTGFV